MVVSGTIVPGFQATGIISSDQVHDQMSRLISSSPLADAGSTVTAALSGIRGIDLRQRHLVTPYTTALHSDRDDVAGSPPARRQAVAPGHPCGPILLYPAAPVQTPQQPRSVWLRAAPAGWTWRHMVPNEEPLAACPPAF
jgi:hypothetical protein